MSCEMSTTERPRSRTRRIRSSTVLLCLTPNAAVGSSMITTWRAEPAARANAPAAPAAARGLLDAEMHRATIDLELAHVRGALVVHALLVEHTKDVSEHTATLELAT